MSNVTGYESCPMDQDQCVVPLGGEGTYADCLIEWGTYTVGSTGAQVKNDRAGSSAVSASFSFLFLASAVALFATMA